MSPKQDKAKRLDLLSGLGAGILGAGLALLFASKLEPYAIPALLIGIASHGYAMFAKGRLERQEQLELPKWARVAEWACWLMLAGLFGYVIMR